MHFLPVLLRRALLAALLAFVALPMPAGLAGDAFRPFAEDSIWNLPVRADAPTSPESAKWVAWLSNQVRTGVPWISSRTCGMPFYWAAADTPPVTVTLRSSVYQDRGLLRS